MQLLENASNLERVGSLVLSRTRAIEVGVAELSGTDGTVSVVPKGCLESRLTDNLRMLVETVRT